jgi:hypothetical protein
MLIVALLHLSSDNTYILIICSIPNHPSPFQPTETLRLSDWAPEPIFDRKIRQQPLVLVA